MGQHAKRFDAVNAPKGSGQAAVVEHMKAAADTIEEWFDPNSSEVIRAIMRFEQGLALLANAPAHPEAGEPAKSEKPAVTGARRKPTPKKKDGDTPEGEQTGESEKDGS